MAENEEDPFARHYAGPTIGDSEHPKLFTTSENPTEANPLESRIRGVTFENESPRRDNTPASKAVVLKFLLFTSIGALFAIFHHIFYMMLSHHPKFASPLKFGHSTIGPSWALTVGNGLSWLVQLFYTLAIGGVLVQRFWHLLHDRHFTLNEMNDVFSITSAFYTKTAIFRVPGLALFAVISLGMGAVISTFVPPSLAVSVRPLSEPCNIFTVDFTGTSIDPNSTIFKTPAVDHLARQVIFTQSNVVPQSSPCSNCTYNVTYSAPALTCERVPLAATLPFFHPELESATHTTIWNTSVLLDPPNPGSVSILIWSRVGSFSGTTGNYSDPETIGCVTKNATYHVNVDHRNGTRVTANVDIVPFSQNIPNETALAFEALGQSLGSALGGTMVFNVPPKADSGEVDGFPFIAYTTLGTYSPTSWALNVDLLTNLPTLMHNISTSLLAGSLTPDGTKSTLSPVPDGQCFNESTVYVYDRVRLLVVYGVALLVTLVCVASGIHSVIVGRGGSMSFTSLVYAITSPEMIEAVKEQELSPQTVIHAVKGRFVPGEIG
ncbi:hypothetical protein BD410DRAFT_808734 [Rickenella mellea]|uniref:Uncharacterized protein n=1 Tax=Rickenella mellea TaxID=50990 RepID=A0A4Y7PML0_9AGAM|nr:hypothetical protein BD410DRAFT_808734 [Rickenella mellea]